MERNTQKPGGSLIQSVDRALSIVDYIAQSREELGLTELSKKTGLNKGTSYGLLNTLEKHGYVSLDPNTKKYRLGYHLAQLGVQVAGMLDVRREAKPYMDELVKKYHASVQLGISADDEVLYVSTSISAHFSLPIACQVGLRSPFYCSGVGKAIMAYWSDDVLTRYLSSHPLAPRTPHTITDPEALKKELSLIREQGYALDQEENQMGVISFSAPIFSLGGEVTSALSCGILSAECTPKLTYDLSNEIKNCTQLISKQLGYTP